jgi:hypothetical protein
MRFRVQVLADDGTVLQDIEATVMAFAIGFTWPEGAPLIEDGQSLREWTLHPKAVKLKDCPGREPMPIAELGLDVVPDCAVIARTEKAEPMR